jgi:NADH-quinone oxidoreductase subunit I
MNVIRYFSEIGQGVGTLLKGLRVTAGYFFSPSEIVTQKYPENRKTLVMPERFKGEVIMPHTDDNHHRCTGCGICQTNCPNDSILVLTSKNEEGKKVLDTHIYHLESCTFCGLCVKTCPSDALAFGNEFEHAVFNRAKLTKTLNQPGSSLKKEIKS